MLSFYFFCVFFHTILADHDPAGRETDTMGLHGWCSIEGNKWTHEDQARFMLFLFQMIDFGVPLCKLALRPGREEPLLFFAIEKGR